MDAPATPADAFALWPDAAGIDPATLVLLLDTAWEACEAFVPAEQVPPVDAGTDPVPHRWVTANVLHARDVWTAYRQDGGVIGFDAYAVTVKPLSGPVRALLRPPRGVPQVG